MRGPGRHLWTMGDVQLEQRAGLGAHFNIVVYLRIFSLWHDSHQGNIVPKGAKISPWGTESLDVNMVCGSPGLTLHGQLLLLNISFLSVHEIGVHWTCGSHRTSFFFSAKHSTYRHSLPVGSHLFLSSN